MAERPPRARRRQLGPSLYRPRRMHHQRQVVRAGPAFQRLQGLPIRIHLFANCGDSAELLVHPRHRRRHDVSAEKPAGDLWLDLVKNDGNVSTLHVSLPSLAMKSVLWRRQNRWLLRRRRRSIAGSKPAASMMPQAVRPTPASWTCISIPSSTRPRFQSKCSSAIDRP